MRKIILLTLMIFSLTFGQNIKVLETKILVQKEHNKEFSFPTFSPQGDKVLFTSAGYQGLWIYDIETTSIKNLNNLKGAGYQPVFSEDGNKVFFRYDKMIKKRKYSSIAYQDIQNLKIQNLIKEEREISPPKFLKNEVIVYKKNNKQVTFSYENDNQVCLLKKTVTKSINAFTENSNLYLEKDGKKTIINPVGEGHYIWGSLSPNNDKIVFTLAGKGTFVTDLQGKVELTLTNANYPGWSKDGKWIVFMEDIDDGHQVISSEIKVTNLKTAKTFQLTSTKNKLEMYPTWSQKENNIVYHTNSGNIEMLKLEIQE